MTTAYGFMVGPHGGELEALGQRVDLVLYVLHLHQASQLTLEGGVF